MDISQPLSLHQETVRPEYIDRNDHMNLAFYVLVFDHATDAFFDFVGLDTPYRERNGSTTFAVETHTSYVRELRLGAPLRVTTQLLGLDAKRVHYFHRMYHAGEGYLAATTEVLSLHVDRRIRRSAPLPAAIAARLAELDRAHARLPWPEQAGRAIGIPRGPQRIESSRARS